MTESILNDRYQKRIVQFGSQPGNVVLNSLIGSYLNSFVKVIALKGGMFTSGETFENDKSNWKLGELVPVKNAPSDSLTVHVVKPIDIEPKFKSLYLGTEKEFKFIILEGSGHFTVSHDNPDLIDLVHKDREIFIKPKTSAGLI